MKGMKKLALAASVCFAALLITNPMKVDAKNPSIVGLKSGKIYTGYDITGDKKNDKIKIATPKNKYGDYDTVKITVNKKTTTLKNSWPAFGIKTKLVTLKNAKPYLWITGNAEDDDDPWQVLYQYKNGKMVKAVDFMDTVEKYGDHIGTTVVSVKDNTITVKQGFMSGAMGGVTYNVNYAYKNGALKKTASAYKITDAAYRYVGDKKIYYGTMRNSKTLYSDVTCTKKLGAVKKGTKAAAVKIYMTGKDINIKIKTKDGKIGWLKGSKKMNENKLLFKECFYAG